MPICLRHEASTFQKSRMLLRRYLCCVYHGATIPPLLISLPFLTKMQCVQYAQLRQITRVHQLKHLLFRYTRLTQSLQRNKALSRYQYSCQGFRIICLLFPFEWVSGTHLSLEETGSVMVNVLEIQLQCLEAGVSQDRLAKALFVVFIVVFNLEHLTLVLVLEVLARFRRRRGG